MNSKSIVYTPRLLHSCNENSQIMAVSVSVSPLALADTVVVSEVRMMITSLMIDFQGSLSIVKLKNLKI